MELEQLCQELESVIKNTYESGVSLDEAERLAAKFLYAQIKISEELKVVDLDSRMRKNGVKAIRSAVRSNEVKQHDKKPTESQLEDVVNLNDQVSLSQDAYDSVDCRREQLENYLMIFKDAHIYYRGISKGRFE